MTNSSNKRGMNEFYYYTLNTSELIYAICHSLHLREIGVSEYV